MKKIIYVFFGAICGLTLIIFVLFNFVLYPKKYNEFVSEFANKYCLEDALVFAIIKSESNFKTDVISGAGAVGLMQILPSTAQWIAEELGEEFNQENLLDAETNIKYGCFYLNYLFSKFQDMDTVICAYNAGEGIVKNWLDENGELDIGLISYSETLNYLKKVKSSYSVYKSFEFS